jgi:hypothetical protein
MTANNNIDNFLSQYNETVIKNSLMLREVLLKNLPDIIEQIDLPAKMIAYCYGQKYAELICVVIPSEKGLKLGFNRGVEIDDPDNLLEGNGKVSRYVQIKSTEQITSLSLKKLLTSALNIYKQKQRKK